MAFCTECGEELIEGDSFCRECGAPIATEHEQPDSDDVEIQPDDDSDKAGDSRAKTSTPDKCPACGEPLMPGDKVCPACDYQIAKLEATSAMNEFIKGLCEVEACASSGSTSYNAVVEEIGRAAIPHTVEGVLAFLVIVKGRVGTSIRDYGQGLEARKAVLQAWLSKTRSVYDLARLSFSEEPEFHEIEQTYQKINAVAGVKGAIDGVVTVNNSLLNKGCLGKVIWFFIVIILLGLMLNVLNTARSNYLIVLLVVAVIGSVIYLRVKKSNS